jgi:hypothetical protein
MIAHPGFHNKIAFELIYNTDGSDRAEPNLEFQNLICPSCGCNIGVREYKRTLSTFFNDTLIIVGRCTGCGNIIEINCNMETLSSNEDISSRKIIDNYFANMMCIPRKELL